MLASHQHQLPGHEDLRSWPPWILGSQVVWDASVSSPASTWPPAQRRLVSIDSPVQVVPSNGEWSHVVHGTSLPSCTAHPIASKRLLVPDPSTRTGGPSRTSLPLTTSSVPNRSNCDTSIARAKDPVDHRVEHVGCGIAEVDQVSQHHQLGAAVVDERLHRVGGRKPDNGNLATETRLG